MADLMKACGTAWGIGPFQRPCQIVRHMYAPTPGFYGRHDVGFERVAHHHAPFRSIAIMAEDAGIGGCGLLADDLDRVEEIAQPGLGEFALLVEQHALGYENTPVVPGKLLER